jgi:RNA-binding protein
VIKVRVLGADRSGREAILEEICRQTEAQPVQHIGKILVLFRENPEPFPDSEKDSVRRRRRGR